jgi:ribonuclease J
VSADDGKTLAEHELILRGVPLPTDEPTFLREARQAIAESLDRAAANDVHEVELIQKALHDDLAEFVYRRLRRRPMIIPVIVEL